MSNLENKILDALDEIRPFLLKDGGDTVSYTHLRAHET